MTEPNAQNEKPKDERRYDPELLKKGLRCDLDQYEMLKRCSDNEDMGEWNEWRKNHSNKDILLQGADFSHFYLKKANLKKANLYKTIFHMAHLEYAVMDHAIIRDANLRARLQNAKLRHTDLSETDLWRAHLEGADFYGACLKGAQFAMGQVNGETMIARCSTDRFTDFTGVALMNSCIEPALRQLLEYNIRWLGWNKWYDNVPQVDWDSEKSNQWDPQPPKWLRVLKKAFVRPFWCLSDYGHSTRRIVGCFFLLAFVFGLVYWLWPSCVIVNGTVGAIRGFWHALYFSVVTMTTLGFGDIAANPDSWLGQTLLMAQVILGYVLLGALVTRFAVLFTAGGPAESFSKDK